MRIALAQINTTVGDLTRNADLILATARKAAEGGAQVAVFPELAITGYPPRDLLEKPSFLVRAERELARLTEAARGLPLDLIVGAIGPSIDDKGKRVTNRAVVIRDGAVVFVQIKRLLPTYDVFDEGRYFDEGPPQALTTIQGTPTGLIICEDAWNDKQFWERQLYEADPVEDLIRAGARALISINASPYHMGKRAQRREIFSTAARRNKAPFVYVNLVGGNDQLVFDGSSFVMDAEGNEIATAKSFDEDLVFVDLDAGVGDQHANLAVESEAVYEALVLGTRDYLHKCGFKRVLLGLSGGIDSSITACIAVDAVGRENVAGFGMPGPYSSDHSVTDARVMAEKLGIRFELVPIKEQYEAFLRRLDPVFGDVPRDVTEENLQARLRGVTLMAASNKWGALVLTTGNKSELAVGYCTLYGDMCGGLAVISDVPKTLVYELSRIANKRHNGAIPENVFMKPPSAELRPDQKDTDSLPPYEVLDTILRDYVEEYRAPKDIAERHGYSLDLVRDIINKVDRNEYKRQQAAPGLKVTTKAFGIGRRFPIAQRFSE
ncbi:MAG TPA: NAD+ synthase [Bryobacteraceae bacterium]|nr:NAD+ synthase [Bryobacteraceae bacterium]